jgi:outer membrane cobalamin receptor
VSGDVSIVRGAAAVIKTKVMETRMNRKPNPTRIALAVAVALLHLGAAHAQTAAAPDTAAPAAANPNDGLKLDSVVVTGTSTKLSKMKQSVSVSTLDSEQIERSGATSAAELLRSIPGIRSESSGGEGNANITVRGVPISAGGARYVQIQEDGLPMLMFGDIAFGTADQFLRADFNIERLEVVRGGSASTLATNSPGGLINFLSSARRPPFTSAATSASAKAAARPATTPRTAARSRPTSPSSSTPVMCG